MPLPGSYWVYKSSHGLVDYFMLFIPFLCGHVRESWCWEVFALVVRSLQDNCIEYYSIFKCQAPITQTWFLRVFVVVLVWFLMVLKSKPTASYILGMRATTVLGTQPLIQEF